MRVFPKNSVLSQWRYFLETANTAPVQEAGFSVAGHEVHAALSAPEFNRVVPNRINATV